MNFQVESLADHELKGFDCGNAELNSWLIDHARAATGQGTRTYILVDQEKAIVGYFAIAPHFINRDEAPRGIGRGAPRLIPAILLAKLALDRSLQGHGLGTELLVFALKTIIEAARNAGGRIVVVDAIDDEAIRFYEHHDFQPTPGNAHRLVLKLSTVAKVLGVAWP